jgi:ATP-dependent DNA helicase RecG
VIGLTDPVSSVKGIGARKEAALGKLNIKTVDDLLRHYPRDYEDRRNKRKISELSDGVTAAVQGEIVSKRQGFRRGGKSQPLRLLVEDGTGALEVVFFNAAYLERRFSEGKTYVFFGSVTKNGGKLQMTHPEFSEAGSEDCAEILPVYPLTAGITQNDMRKWIKSLNEKIFLLKEYLPENSISRNRLCGVRHALENIHFPRDGQRLREAKYRLVFEELLLLQTGLLLIKNKNAAKGEGVQLTGGGNMEDFIGGLPYKLTEAQRRTLSEIARDMESPRAMNRLVQGDVGSGKTVVAAAAMYKTVRSGYQAVIMAPTEILAKQHFEEFQSLFRDHGVRVGFLSGSVKGNERKTLLAELEGGGFQILVGTHAVIRPDVAFQKLGLVVTDEQHRFGVNQRILLSQKGKSPDVLVMTATPIPRTLAFILYGDLDISLIDERPPGRRRVITKATDSGGREEAYAFLKQQLRNGNQAYVVAPRIEDSEESAELKSVSGLYRELTGKLSGFQVALLHGAMKQREKDEVMARFYAGEIDVLVATVLIEVGVDVPRATVMLIENAERFGLAQLHQLRGRVGRGSAQSFCLLITDGKSPEAKERAKIMASTDDGFVIAEKDLSLRGPGEFFGLRQHGVPQLKIADLVKHIKALSAVRKEAGLLLDDDALLSSEKNRPFMEKIRQMFKAVEMKAGL